ncbi:MAG: hypothetical protein ACRDK4_02265 [Solirubrobacteraceae bacterium]
MSTAKVVKVPTDRVGARDYLNQARQFSKDSETDVISSESKQVLIHQAAISGCDAILLASGFRIRGSEGGHELRLREALKRVAPDEEELLDDLLASRDRRSEASYAAEPVARASVAEARDALAQLLELAASYLADTT